MSADTSAVATLSTDLEFLAELSKPKRKIAFFGEKGRAENQGRSDNEQVKVFSASQSFGVMQRQIWPSSIRLAQFLISGGFLNSEQGNGVKLVEVGSGLGLVANAAAVFGAATAVATDCIIPEPKQRLLEVSSGLPVESVSWSRVDWHATDSSATTLKEFGPFDLIVGADIIYSKSLFLALAQTLGTLLRGSAPGAKCFLCNQIRRPKEEDEFFNKVLPMYGMVAQLSDDDGETSMLHVYAASQSSGVMDHDPQAEVLNAKIIKYTRLFKVQLANDLSSSSSFSVTEQGQCDGMYL